jgi:hypothetical protein
MYDMPKFTCTERMTVKNIVAMLTIKRIPDSEIIKSIFDQIGKTTTVSNLTRIKQEIKRDSYQWYKTMREGEYEYIHEFRERIKEIEPSRKMTAIAYASLIGGAISWFVVMHLFHDNPIVKEIMKITTYLPYG